MLVGVTAGFYVHCERGFSLWCQYPAAVLYVTLIARLQCWHFKFTQSLDMFEVSISNPKQLPTCL